MAGKGTMLAKVGWPAKKFYLSPEAIELLRQHCEGTPLTMSAYLDLLIKQNLGAAPPSSKFPPRPKTEHRPVPGSTADVPYADRITTAADKEKPFDL